MTATWERKSCVIDVLEIYIIHTSNGKLEVLQPKCHQEIQMSRRAYWPSCWSCFLMLKWDREQKTLRQLENYKYLSWGMKELCYLPGKAIYCNIVYPVLQSARQDTTQLDSSVCFPLNCTNRVHTLKHSAITVHMLHFNTPNKPCQDYCVYYQPEDDSWAQAKPFWLGWGKNIYLVRARKRSYFGLILLMKFL